MRIQNPQDLDVTLFANEEVFIDHEGIRQLLEFLSLQDTIEQLCEAQTDAQAADFFDLSCGQPALEQVVLTPDFHKSGGIPVGTVAKTRGFIIPQAVGNDICCGMRFIATDLTRDDLEPVFDQLQARLRQIFFEGQRDLPMSPRQREAMLHEGLQGLYQTRQDNAGRGLWRLYERDSPETALAHVHAQGSLQAQHTFAFDDYIRASGAQDGRDSQIGSIGGGNHFVELQAVEELLDGATAYAWGIKEGAVMIMAHSGSVGLGHLVGGHFKDQTRARYPKGIAHPSHGFYPLPTQGPHAALATAYLDAMANAANFAFANRMFLGLMVIQALEDVLGRRIEHRLIYDAPHNLIWSDHAQDTHLHRKGACPAYGAEHDVAGPFQYTGPPVIIPGSMGASSYLMAGLGHEHALCSACHGAGRMVPRGVSRHMANHDDELFKSQIEPLRVVTPIDPKSPQVRLRPDVLAQHRDRLAEEGPHAYKPVEPVIETIAQAKIARGVARMWPLLTIKG